MSKIFLNCFYVDSRNLKHKISYFHRLCSYFYILKDYSCSNQLFSTESVGIVPWANVASHHSHSVVRLTMTSMNLHLLLFIFISPARAQRVVHTQ